VLTLIILAGCGTAPAPASAPTAPTAAAAAPTLAPAPTAVATPNSAPNATNAPATQPEAVTLTFAFPDDAASSAAAQAAAHQRNVGAAVAAAQDTADAMLVDVTACAGGPMVSIGAANFRPGGDVTVVVSCSPARSDLALAGPSAATFTASSTASIDMYRSAGLP